MDKSEEFFKKEALIKKYSNKPIPKFLKFLGHIKTLDEFEGWIKEQEVVMLKWIGSYLILLPFFVFFCLTALNLKNAPNVLEIILLAEGISISWYLLISLIKDIRGAIKNG
ncbi:hypothetical protein LCGC14_0948480 [marine sediment metagenome]|uniref:Uncharacterized protein n=1 Tax=marine sediment metagenome TaxID=412755 RepID=A0A0F9P430_9ZZZZ